MKTGIRMSMQAGAVGWIFRQVKRRICLVDNFRETDRGGHLHVSEQQCDWRFDAYRDKHDVMNKDL